MLQDESSSNRRFSMATQCLNLFACNIISIVTSGSCDGRLTNSFKRSGVSGLLIRKTRMLFAVVRRPVNSIVGWLVYLLLSRITPSNKSLGDASCQNRERQRPDHEGTLDETTQTLCFRRLKPAEIKGNVIP